MKQGLIFCSMLLLATLILAVVPTEAEAQIYEDTVRLHILANSDSEEDQELKLKVRDKLLLKYGDILGEAECAEGAVELGSSLLREIEADCEEWIRELGCSYTVEATLTEEWYDTREYDGFTLPSGVYHSLRVIIGEGEGKNWWCIMYPPICTDIATESAPTDDGIFGYTERETALISRGKYNIKFKGLELFSKLFSKK